MDKYEWLVKHLIWNGPKQTNGTYWIKVSEEDVKTLSTKYEIVETITYKKKKLNVIRMFDNNIVLCVQ